MKPDETDKSDGLMIDDIENGFLQARSDIRAPAPPSPGINHKKRPLTADTNHEGGNNEGGQNQIAALATAKASISQNRMVYLNNDQKNTN